MESLTRFLACVAVLVPLAGCFERSASGIYIAKDSSSAELLQLTEGQDGSLVGTWQRLNLQSDGRIATSTTNVTGIVNGESLALTLSLTALPISKNLSGMITTSGLEFQLVDSAGGVNRTHFVRSDAEQFNAESQRLAQAAQTIKAERSRAKQVDSLNRSVLILVESLDTFVKKARKQIDATPRFIFYFAQASNEISKRLQYAQHLSFGNSIQQGQADGLLGRLSASESAIRNASESIDQAIENATQEEASLNVQMIGFNGICLGQASAVTAGSVIPDMGPCKALIAAVARFREVVGPLHQAYGRLQTQKARAIKEMEVAWQFASASKGATQ